MLYEERHNKNTTKANFQEEKNMRKNIVRLLSLSLVIIMTCLTGCGNIFASDNAHATMTAVSSTGRTGIYESYNGYNLNKSGEQLALIHCFYILLEHEESVTLVFKCEACGNEQEFTIDSACSKVICCDCPEEGDENGNAKEYICIKVGVEQD